MGQIFLQIGYRALMVALRCHCQTPVAVIRPRVRLQHNQAVQHRHQTRPVLLCGVDFLEVVEHAANDVAGRG